MLSVFVGPRLSRSFSLTRGELAASTEAKLMTFRCRRMQVGCWSAPLQLGIRRDMARPACASLALVANPEALHSILKGHQPRQFGDRQSLTLVMRDREEVPFRLAVANRDRERAARNVVSANERNLPYHVLARAEALLESHGHRYMRVRRQSLLKPGDPHHVHCGEHCQQYGRRVESDADGNS